MRKMTASGTCANQSVRRVTKSAWTERATLAGDRLATLTSPEATPSATSRMATKVTRVAGSTVPVGAR